MTDKKTLLIKKLVWLASAALVVFFDQITKNAVVSYFSDVGASKTVIPGLLDFTYVRNPGATAGILANNRWVFMSVSVIIIVLITVYLAISKKQSFFGGLCFSLIIGGGIGNMIDRIAMGEVVDFLDVTATDIFPFNCIFNVADAFVCVGCALLILSFIIDEVKDRKKKANTEASREDDGGEISR